MTRIRALLTFSAAVFAAAACQPAPEAAGPVLPDSATVHAAIQAVADAYEAAELAGDAAAVAQLYTENGTLALEGVPTTTGRANIEAMATASFAEQTITRADIVVASAGAQSPTVATAGGTATFDVTAGGASRTDTWRWAAEYTLGADGVWRTSYLIAFLEVPPPM